MGGNILILFSRENFNGALNSLSSAFLLIKVDLFEREWQKERESQRERERGVLRLVVHSPDGLNDQGRAELKPGSWNSIQVSYHDGRVPST